MPSVLQVPEIKMISLMPSVLRVTEIQTIGPMPLALQVPGTEADWSKAVNAAGARDIQTDECDAGAQLPQRVRGAPCVTGGLGIRLTLTAVAKGPFLRGESRRAFLSP